MTEEVAPVLPGEKLPPKKLVATSVAVALSALTVFLLLGREGVNREQAYMGGSFILAAVLWVTEAIPLFATYLVVVGLQILLLASPGGWPGLGFEACDSPEFRTYIAAAADPVIVLFFGGFLL